MDTKDLAVEKTKLVINALEYAQIHNLDISHKDDVKKSLEALDANDQDIDELMKLLQYADAFMEISAKEKELDKSDLPN